MRSALAAVLFLSSALSTQAEGVLNLYSSRHYDTDERLYSDFTEATGIEINRIEGKADELIARMEAEGANSPADVLLTVDAGRIWRAEQKGLLQPVESEVLEARIPAALQSPDNHWFGFSQRARIIFYSKDRVETPPQTYADLADPAYQGKICIRSATNIYNLSLLGSIIEHEGQEAAKAWAEGVKANFARDPQGGDTDQLRGIVSGECDIVVANSYYFARAMRKDVEGLSANIDEISWVFPNQDGNGAHVNISAAGVAANAPNPENAVKFLEYLASDQAQAYFSSGNDEYPVVEGVDVAANVMKLGDFTPDDLNLSVLGENQSTAEQIFNEIGWE